MMRKTFNSLWMKVYVVGLRLADGDLTTTTDGLSMEWGVRTCLAADPR
jgi:hypothetical protein